MAYEIKLDSFEGPLDLLLHLIDKAEMDIYDIAIAEITEQYMQHLYVMQELQLEIASEFLVMAATLLAIKSKMLLPRREETVFQPMFDMDVDGEYHDDPRAELVERLLEYRKYKNMAEVLREREVQRSKVFTRPPVNLTPYINQQEEENPVKDVSLYDLMEALQKALTKAEREKPMARVHRDEISVKDRMKEITQQLTLAGGKLRFSALFSGRWTRVEIVTSFLAILELMKNERIRCEQDRLFDDILIML